MDPQVHIVARMDQRVLTAVQIIHRVHIVVKMVQWIQIVHLRE